MTALGIGSGLLGMLAIIWVFALFWLDRNNASSNESGQVYGMLLIPAIIILIASLLMSIVNAIALLLGA